MRHVRWAFLLLIALVVAPVPAIVTAAPAHACSCLDSTPEEVWENVSVAVIATVTARHGDPSSDDELGYELAVSAIYKGTTSDVLTFTATVDGAACGWMADVGDTDQLYLLHGPEDDLSTSVCTMSQATPIPDEYVGAEYAPTTSGSSTGAQDDGGADGAAAMSWAPLWLGLGLGVVVLTGLWLALRRPLR